MRVRPLNPNGETMHELECTNFECKYSPNAITTVVWTKEYLYDKHCTKCGRALTETSKSWRPMPDYTKQRAL